jgi:glycosyltransferase involved in cell wall biosynthesis
MISVFIPAYNAHDYIDYAVMSLANQTARDLMKVYIINDGSDRDYKDVIDKFSAYINIVEITHEKNMGVGFARQTALNILDTKYFAFLDADDLYIDATAFEYFYAKMEENPNHMAVFGHFYQELKDGSYLLHEKTNVWIFCKIYRSSFVKRNNLSFPNLRTNEDNIFNISFVSCLKGDEIIVNYEKPIYLWKYFENSITRKDNFRNWYYDDLQGLVDGLYYIKDNPNIDQAHFYRNTKVAFFYLYFRYHDNLIYKPEYNFSNDILKLAKKIYNDFLKDNDVWLKDDRIKNIFDIVALDYQKSYADVQMFKDFIEMVK